jgi:dienelactone hydrolase
MNFKSGCLNLFILLFAMAPARAEIIETSFKLPVNIVWRDGAALKHDVIVTRFQDNERKPSRFMVILHGRAPTSAERSAYGRTRFVDIARDFAAQGYAVFVPTRIGYGDTGGPDIEDTGRCDAKDYVTGMAPATESVLQIIAAIRKEPEIGNSSGVIIGQSVGGLLTVSLAARNVPRVVAYVNFAGGSGGDPKSRPGQPCGPDKLAQAYGQFGRKARTPVLWLYSSNDLYWGPDLPREWFAAFKKAGGRGRFVALPAYGHDGHQSFSRNRAAWREPVAQFLQNPN